MKLPKPISHSVSADGTEVEINRQLTELLLQNRITADADNRAEFAEFRMLPDKHPIKGFFALFTVVTLMPIVWLMDDFRQPK